MYNPWFNAYFGDGILRKSSGGRNFSCTFMSTNFELIQLKHVLFSSYGCLEIKEKEQHRNAYGSKPMFSFRVSANPLFTAFANLSLEDKVNSMSFEDLLLFYLDDGSYHKRRKTMHLYSNKTGYEGNILIQNKLKDFGITSTISTDKKKDGRIFYYQYIPRRDAESIIIPKLEPLLRENNVTSLLYKVGICLEQPSQTSP